MTRESKSLARRGWLPPAIILVTIITALSLFLVHESELAIAFVGYAVILLQSRLRLSRIICGFPGAPTVRRFVRAAVFFLPLPFLGLPNLKAMPWGLVAGLLYGLLLILLRLPELRFNLSPELISLLPPLTQEDRWRETFHPILGAIAQEYFYRGVLLYGLAPHLGLWSVIIVTFLFTVEHFMQRNAFQTFDGKDYALQTVLSLGLGVIFYFSGSLSGCILGHLTYNFPGAIQAFRRPLETR